MYNKRLLIILASNNNNKEVQIVVMSFVDNRDFCTDGVESEKKGKNFWITMQQCI